MDIVSSIAMTGLTWLFLIGFLVLAAFITSDNDVTDTKAYKDLNETMLNRNEDV